MFLSELLEFHTITISEYSRKDSTSMRIYWLVNAAVSRYSRARKMHRNFSAISRNVEAYDRLSLTARLHLHIA